MCGCSEKSAGFRRVTLLGLGAMGASLGLALKRLASRPCVTGYSRSARTRDTALEMGIVDRICDDPAEAAAGADLIVGCLPILALAPVFKQLRPALADGVLLTDIGSTKLWLDGELRKAVRGSPGVYIGSHPMTGTEKSGPLAARVDLYHNAPVFLTPSATDADVCIERLSCFWRSVGARVHIVTASEHDGRVARTSHLPHLVAAALVANAFRDNPGGMHPFLGPGFRSTTRIAGGPPGVWHDIIRTNRTALLQELAAFQRTLGSLHTWLQNEDFENIRLFLEQAQICRRREMLPPCAP